ncbi:MAG: transposase domain-containing protein [Limnochordia bacterium]|jgi:ParB-like chromosome segregation protein Spo0J
MRCAELEMLNHNLELLNTELKQQIIEISDKTRWLEEQLRLAVHRRYSPSSERYCSGQMLLDLCEDVASAQAATVQAEAGIRGRGRKNYPFPPKMAPTTRGEAQES